jgi:hypothetical protein
MALTGAAIRAALERAGDEHWRALVEHHESAYPRPCPTPGAIAHYEAERLNRLGHGDGWELIESYAKRVGDKVELVHGFRQRPSDELVWTAPFANYEPATE